MLRPTLLVLAALALPVRFAPSTPRTTIHEETPEDIPDLRLRDTVATARAAAGEGAGDGIPTRGAAT